MRKATQASDSVFVLASAALVAHISIENKIGENMSFSVRQQLVFWGVFSIISIVLLSYI